MWSQLPTDSNDLKAVMVWIHGGIFITGSGTSVLFGPDHLLTEDIVFVSINYRLGVLGISYSRYVRLCYVR
jgi:carboxylesterase type B